MCFNILVPVFSSLRIQLVLQTSVCHLPTTYGWSFEIANHHCTVQLFFFLYQLSSRIKYWDLGCKAPPTHQYLYWYFRLNLKKSIIKKQKKRYLCQGPSCSCRKLINCGFVSGWGKHWNLSSSKTDTAGGPHPVRPSRGRMEHESLSKEDVHFCMLELRHRPLPGSVP